jgi:hypothetical protein
MRNAARTTIVALVMTALAASVPQAQAQRRGNDNNGAYAIGLWGDVPYSVAQEVGVKNLIVDMNSQKLAFTAHNGDLKSGGSECTVAVYQNSVGYFNSLKAPAVFTPGDNDWTDCDRITGYNSLAQLDYERLVFFSNPYTLGQRQLRQEVQTTPLCLGFGGKSVQCVENRRWNYGGVTYVTLNVQGSCNNLCDTAPDPVEYSMRNAANIAWMKEAFAEAKRDRSAGLMIISQANPGFDATDGSRGPVRVATTLAEATAITDGFKDFLTAVRAEVIAFKLPVAYVHGDSHYFRIDKPFLNAAGQRLENFTRVETFGDNAVNGNNDVNWVKVFVDPRSREVFAYQPQIVPNNRVAVP